MASQAIQGPGSINLDMALARLFRIREKYSLQVRGEALNVMNHVNPGNSDCGGRPDERSGSDP